MKLPNKNWTDFAQFCKVNCWSRISCPVCPGNVLMFSVTEYGLKLYLCQDTQHPSQFFCFSSSFSAGNKTETHYHHLPNTPVQSSPAKWMGWCSGAVTVTGRDKKRKLFLIIALWCLESEISGSFILTCCNYPQSEPSQQIVKFLDLTEKIVQLRSTKAE